MLGEAVPLPPFPRVKFFRLIFSIFCKLFAHRTLLLFSSSSINFRAPFYRCQPCSPPIFRNFSSQVEGVSPNFPGIRLMQVVTALLRTSFFAPFRIEAEVLVFYPSLLDAQVPQTKLRPVLISLYAAFPSPSRHSA